MTERNNRCTIDRPTSRALSAAACAALVVALAACSSSGGTGTTTSSGAGASTGSTAGSTAASPAGPGATANTSSGGGSDTKSLLIAASDIPIDGFTVLSSGAAPGGVEGGTIVFADKAKSRTVTDVVAKLPSADAAATAAKAAVSSAGGQITGGKTSSVSIGDGGTQISGTASGASNTVVVFTKGTYFVTMSFAAAKSDPVPDSLVEQVAKAQADKLG